jgi:hypothetical protein
MGMGFWNREGKGNRGAGSRRCRLPPCPAPDVPSCPFPHWRFVAPKMAPSHPRKVRPYHGCVLIYLHLRTNGRQVFLWSQKLGFLLGHIRIQDQKKLEALGDHHDRSQMVSSLSDPRSHPRFGPISTRSRTTRMEDLRCVLPRT